MAGSCEAGSESLGPAACSGEAAHCVWRDVFWSDTICEWPEWLVIVNSFPYLSS